MAKKLPSVDVLMIGFGWTGAVVGQELTDAGLQVLALERGNWRVELPLFHRTPRRG